MWKNEEVMSGPQRGPCVFGLKSVGMKENLRPRSRRNHCLPAEVLGFSTSTPPGSHSDREVTQGTKEMGLTTQVPCGKRRGQLFVFTL